MTAPLAPPLRPLASALAVVVRQGAHTIARWDGQQTARRNAAAAVLADRARAAARAEALAAFDQPLPPGVLPRPRAAGPALPLVVVGDLGRRLPA